MPNAVIDQIADGVVTLISAAWSSPPSGSSVAAVDLPYETESTMTGIQVQVFAAAWSDQGVMTRAPEFDEEYTVTIVVMSRYTGSGDPTQSFCRGMRQFVEQTIYNVLKDPTQVQIAINTPNGSSYVWPLRVDEVQAYDPGRLKYQKIFWSALTMTFAGQCPI